MKDAFDVLNQRGVTRLCHFTKIQSLTHILSSEEGILATSHVKSDSKNQVDSVRADGELDYVCCSIEYPNSWFLCDAENRNEDSIFRDWVIIYIKPEVLNIRDVKVCWCNSAKEYGRFIRPGNTENTQALFAQRVSSFSYPRTERMLECCTTDAQAEILIKDNIPRNYLMGIAVGREEVAEIIYAMIKTLDINPVELFIAPKVLTKEWRRLIQNGERPEEAQYIV